MTTCPKCGYVRQASDPAPDYECPKCGVIYAKVRPLEGTAPAPAREDQPNRPRGERVSVARGMISEPSPQRIRWIDDRQNRILVAAVVISLTVGYFAGREHLKYEFRSALADAAQGFRKALAGELPAKPSKPPETREQPIVPTLVKKGFREEEYGQDTITLAVDFSNRTGQDIRAFDGSLILTDLLENRILTAKIAVNDPIPAGSTYSWSGGISYNQFIESHQSLRNADVENMKAQLHVGKVLFSDGQTKDYGK